MQHPLDDFIDSCRKDVANWRDLLDRMERGALRTGDIQGPDDTATSIKIYRKMIEKVQIDIERAEEIRRAQREGLQSPKHDR